ncbi:MAG: hypothetical protein RI909_2267 [Bacteroidota bacterium]|jgi:hypothetical protein
MIQFTATIHKFDKQGEKTGWTYIEISATQAKKLKPDTKVSFRVKGSLDSFKIKQIALIPMGEGNFIMPLNATMRKAIGKKLGDKLNVSLQADESEFTFSQDFIACLQDDPVAYDFFQTLTGSHQKYFSKWIDSAKTSFTKTKRIAMAVTALSKKQGYPEMIRANKISR